MQNTDLIKALTDAGVKVLDVNPRYYRDHKVVGQRFSIYWNVSQRGKVEKASVTSEESDFPITELEDFLKYALIK